MIREHENPDGTVTLEYGCDFCAFSTKLNVGSAGFTPIMECSACGRLVCSGHRRFFREPLIRSHRGMYCLECWELGRNYRDEMISVQNQAWEKENDLRLKWHREGRANKRQRLANARMVRAAELSSTLA